jgi:hypothetical protein
MEFWVGTPEGNRPTGRPRRRWKDNVKMDLRETAWYDMGWIHLAQDRDQWRALVNMVMNLSGFVKFWEIFEQLSDRRFLKKSPLTHIQNTRLPLFSDVTPCSVVEVYPFRCKV